MLTVSRFTAPKLPGSLWPSPLPAPTISLSPSRLSTAVTPKLGTCWVPGPVLGASQELTC